MQKESQKRIALAPEYCRNFKCTADKCRHSCCIDWEICIDGATYEKYQEHPEILKTVEICEGEPCFKLRRDGRCPHLTDTGLCSIILAHGERMLAEICRRHPRFVNHLAGGRIEVGLGISCEEACRLILEDERPLALTEIEWIADDRATSNVEPDAAEAPCFDPLPTRDKILSISTSAELGYREKLAAIRAELSMPEIFTLDEWLERLSELEMLDPAWAGDISAIKGRAPTPPVHEPEKYYGRLLTYFIYRHLSGAEGYDALRARAELAILSTETVRALYEAKSGGNTVPDHAPPALIDAARRYSAEIEYSEDNTAELIFELECEL